MKRGRKTMAGEKSSAYNIEVLLGGRDPEASNFVSLLRGLAGDLPKGGGALLAEFIRARPKEMLRTLIEVTKKGDLEAARFFKTVAKLMEKGDGGPWQPVADLPRLMLKVRTETGGPFNATELVAMLASDYGIRVSHTWVLREMKRLGRPVLRRGWR